MLYEVITLNWWQGVGWSVITLGVVLAMALYGWLHGKPVWLFPWRGYYFIPVLLAGVLLLYLPAGWSWVAIVIYLPLNRLATMPKPKVTAKPLMGPVPNWKRTTAAIRNNFV